MMSLWDALRMNMMISYQELVRTFLKSINDNWGHLVGDRVILAVVDIIKDSIRDNDIFARLGGEEFGLLLPDTDGKQAMAVAERIRQNVQQRTGPGYHYALPVKVTLSIGVCSAIQNNVNGNDIMRDVDEALYEAKHNGKNRIVTRQAE